MCSGAESEHMSIRRPLLLVVVGAAHRLRRGFVDKPGVPSDEDLCTRQEACGWYMQKFSRTEQQWQDLYFFREAEATQADFDMMNFWTANHPDSQFQVGHVASSYDVPVKEMLLDGVHARVKEEEKNSS